MKKVILFDFWGTLVQNGIFPSPCKQAKFILRSDGTFQDFIVKFEESFMTKNFETLKDAFVNVAKELNLNIPDFVYDKLVGMWNKNTLLAKTFDETIEVLDELKKDYKIVLISNTDQFSVKAVIEKFSLEKYFDSIILSCETGKLKTNKEIFKIALDSVKAKAKDAVMIGDSIESDIRGAENAKIDAILIDRRDNREYDNKITSLKDLKAKIESL